MKKETIEYIFAVIGIFFVAVIVALLLGLISAFVIEFLWNWLVPSIFHLRAITYWEAYGLGVLSNLLFKPAGATIKSKD